MSNDRYIPDLPKLFAHEEDRAWYLKQFADCLELTVEAFPERVPGFAINYLQSGVDLINLPEATRDQIAKACVHYMAYMAWNEFYFRLTERNISYDNDNAFKYTNNGWEITVTSMDVICWLDDLLFDCCEDFSAWIGAVNLMLRNKDGNQIIDNHICEKAGEKWSRIMAAQLERAEENQESRVIDITPIRGSDKPVKRSWLDRLLWGDK